MVEQEQSPNHEREPKRNVVIKLPCQVDSKTHRLMQGAVNLSPTYRDLGTMVFKQFTDNLAFFLTSLGSDGLEGALPRKKFDEMAEAEKMSTHVEDVFENVDEDEFVNVTLPISIGSGEHYLIEAIAAHQKKGRDRFLFNLTFAFINKMKRQEGEGVLLEFSKPRTPEEEEKFAKFEEIFSAKSPEKD